MNIEISRFLVVGVLSTLAGYLLYALLVSLQFNHYLAMSLAYLLGFLINFYLGRSWVFQQGAKVNSISTEIILTGLMTVVGLGINLLLLSLLNQFAAVLGPYINGGIAMGLVTIWNYTARKIWVYR